MTYIQNIIEKLEHSGGSTLELDEARYLQTMAEEAMERERKVKALEPGQITLVIELKELLTEAEAGEFGDFTNAKYVAPKVALAGKLQELRENVMNGKYD